MRDSQERGRHTGLHVIVERGDQPPDHAASRIVERLPSRRPEVHPLQAQRALDVGRDDLAAMLPEPRRTPVELRQTGVADDGCLRDPDLLGNAVRRLLRAHHRRREDAVDMHVALLEPRAQRIRLRAPLAGQRRLTARTDIRDVRFALPVANEVDRAYLAFELNHTDLLMLNERRVEIVSTQITVFLFLHICFIGCALCTDYVCIS